MSRLRLVVTGLWVVLLSGIAVFYARLDSPSFAATFLAFAGMSVGGGLIGDEPPRLRNMRASVSFLADASQPTRQRVGVGLVYASALVVVLCTVSRLLADI